MSMFVTTIAYTVIIVFGIGKFNKFGDSDEIIEVDKED